ncbi:hypothetical protein [Hymenobacter sp. B1770]|uniref:hypothetical protein n=1 Tax=Hymenobacter sp. B1770 TaxID=1718788 RepID=UPI003CF4CACA
MKKLSVIFATFLLMFLAAGTNKAQAQVTLPVISTVGQLVSGLVTVNVGDITITDVIDVSNVLNNNNVPINVNILNNVLNNSPIASNNSNLLNDLLNLSDNQVVVGVLSGGIVVVRNL